MNNESEEIVGTEMWKCNCFTANYFFPGWDGSTFIQIEHKNADCSEIFITTKKLLELKMVTLHFLLEID